MFFTKSPSRIETINDLDGQVVNLFQVCRDHPDELARLLQFTPLARQEYENVREDSAGQEIQLTDNPIENARRFIVRCSQSFGAKLADRSGWKNSKAANTAHCRTWNDLPNRVLRIAERLKDAQIECRPALQLIQEYNQNDCLIYADPPYLSDTRHGKLYRREMLGIDEHTEFLEMIVRHKGSVVISGYDHPLYNEMLAGWDRVEIQSRNSLAQKKTEILWIKGGSGQRTFL